MCSRLLAQHPKVLVKLRDEISSTVGVGRKSVTPGRIHLKKMKFLNYVIKEGMPATFNPKIRSCGPDSCSPSIVSSCSHQFTKGFWSNNITSRSGSKWYQTHGGSKRLIYWIYCLHYASTEEALRERRQFLSLRELGSKHGQRRGSQKHRLWIITIQRRTKSLLRT